MTLGYYCLEHKGYHDLDRTTEKNAMFPAASKLLNTDVL